LLAVSREVFEAEATLESEMHLLHVAETALMSTYREGRKSSTSPSSLEEKEETEGNGPAELARVLGLGRQTLFARLPAAYAEKMVTLEGEIFARRQRVETGKETLSGLQVAEKVKYDVALRGGSKRFYDFEGFLAFASDVKKALSSEGYRPVGAKCSSGHSQVNDGDSVLANLCKRELVSAHNECLDLAIEEENRKFYALTGCKFGKCAPAHECNNSGDDDDDDDDDNNRFVGYKQRHKNLRTSTKTTSSSSSSGELHSSSSSSSSSLSSYF
jgi:hypothetical protein